MNYDDDVLTQKLIIFLENTQCGYLVILEALVVPSASAVQTSAQARGFTLEALVGPVGSVVQLFMQALVLGLLLGALAGALASVV